MVAKSSTDGVNVWVAATAAVSGGRELVIRHAPAALILMKSGL